MNKTILKSKNILKVKRFISIHIFKAILLTKSFAFNIFLDFNFVLFISYSIFNFFFFDIKGFLTLFCVFGLLNFFPLPYIVCLSVFVLKRLITLSLKAPALFIIGSGTYLLTNHINCS